MIGVDWGTTSLRAWRIDPSGAIISHRAASQGIMAVPDRRFEPVLRTLVGDWIAQGETKILLCGMIGSRQGWVEAPYLDCPAGIDDIAAHLTPIPFDGAALKIVPGLATTDPSGVPDIMRGEETQILGVTAQTTTAHTTTATTICLPGTHSKWAHVTGHRIEHFTTYMTGEIFAALAHHTILARTIQKSPIDPAAFAAGLARAAEPGSLLHHAFGVRTRALRLGITEDSAYAYLSGLLIGHELNAALATPAAPVTIIGTSTLAGLYVTAIRTRGGTATAIDERATATGLAQLGLRTSWT